MPLAERAWGMRQHSVQEERVLNVYSPVVQAQKNLFLRGRRIRFYQVVFLLGFCLVYAYQFLVPQQDLTIPIIFHKHRPKNFAAIISRCRGLNSQLEPPSDFFSRSHSDRFEEGTRPTLIRNARIWTGRKNGTEVVRADILIDKGIIKSIGHLRGPSINQYGTELVVIDAKGAWVTPGLVDVHSHLGVYSSPSLSGASDGNSFQGIVQPWLRSLDGLNTHDDSYPLSIAGGVTTSLILPGSADAIGGQAFVIKLRETKEKSPSSMLLEPPFQINTSFPDRDLPFRWRYIKHACGENPSSVFKGTRMDTMWEFRRAYNVAKRIQQKQDEYCHRALAHDWHQLGEFPEVLKWESLVDVLRGRVKVNVHCYEAVDLDAIVRLSNEFKFPIAVFHHASEAYLVPDLLKNVYGEPPAVALFATFARYKREAYRASEFAPRILTQHGIPVMMKSDHPAAIHSRHLVYEAQQAYYYGLPENVGIASVTSTPAHSMGVAHRIGYINEGYDADIVIWDSHPLALGATPSQVLIDGIPQLESPAVVSKPDAFQETPKVPNFDKETERTVQHEGLPPLEPKKIHSAIIFQNVKTIYKPRDGVIEQIQVAQGNTFGTVVTVNGSIICYDGDRDGCSSLLVGSDKSTIIVNLDGGSISPGLVSFGSPLGLENINQEPSTNDGSVFDPLSESVPAILGGFSSLVRAEDGLQFASRDALLAYRSGVTSAVTAPTYQGFYGGLSVAFSTGAPHKLEKGAIIQHITAVHVSVRHQGKSVSTQIAALRRLLLGPYEGEAGIWFEKVAQGQIPLVVEAHNADVMATLIILKQEVETKKSTQLRLTISGATEAHLLAKELGEATIGVILAPARPFPDVWESRRVLPGPPISNKTSILELLQHKVVVGIGCNQIWQARNLPFDIAWTAIESGGNLSKEAALSMGSTNLWWLLGVEVDHGMIDLVVTRGGDLLEQSSSVAAIVSPSQSASFLLDNV